MKAILLLIAWASLAAAVLYMTIHPQSGVIYQSPMTAIGLGLIGLGLCKHAREQLHRRT